MLSELHIENLGVIERLDLLFGPGLTALTGETGAGKTMLVDALELLVGGRADATRVRAGTAELRVDGRFITGSGAETVISRVVPVDGRSRAYIDGRLATVAEVAALATALVDLHGQHAHQRLLSTATQRAALDRYGGVDLAPLRAARAQLTEIDAELAVLGGDDRARAREIDLLRYQVDELDAAAIDDPDEDERLDAEESVLADATAHREAAGLVIEALTTDGGGRDALSAALSALAGRKPYEDVATRLTDLLAELDDVIAEVRSIGERIEEDPQRLSELAARRQLLVELRRKYGEQLVDVMRYHAEAEARLTELESYDERALELDRRRSEAVAEEQRAARQVAAQRREAAPRLAAEIERGLRALAMPDASVAVEVGEHADDAPGDRVQILLAANPGAPLLPLTRVASGGELARAMLSLRLALMGRGDDGVAVHPETGDTLVFDEVDAGIGGAAAQAVGGALAALAARHQVLVVTHLAQVAALADQQVQVVKDVRDAQTFTTARLLDGDERVDELARMLSGDVTDSARRHARELLG